MHGRTFAARAGAGLAAIAMAASLASTPAFAADDRGKAEHEHGNNGNGNGHGHAHKAEHGNANPGNGQGTPPAHAGGPAAQTPPPGQQETHPAPTQPAKPGKSDKPAKPKHAAKPAKPAHPAKPDHAAKPEHADKPANPHAKAGKTTICHATGSSTNPYVTITISNNALPAHARHQDGRDIIPAPAGGCPAAAPAKSVALGKSEFSEGRIVGSSTETPAPAPAPAASGGAAPAVAEQLESAARGGVMGVTYSSRDRVPELRDTIGSSTTVKRTESGAKPAAAAAKAGQLPFTGLEAALVALAGVFLLLAGMLVRKFSANPGQA
jgi:hypothetical protein